jgi:hypothetical protein
MCDETPKHRKRREGKKRFTILYRCVPGSSGQRMFGDEWSKWGSYKTEARRDQAMDALSVKCFEYKKGEL